MEYSKLGSLLSRKADLISEKEIKTFRQNCPSDNSGNCVGFDTS